MPSQIEQKMTQACPQLLRNLNRFLMLYRIWTGTGDKKFRLSLCLELEFRA
jgi:hypothetical protein